MFTLFESEEYSTCIETFSSEDNGFIDDFLKSFKIFGQKFSNNLQLKLNEIDLLSDSELNDYLINNSIGNYDSQFLLHERFENIVEKYPDKIAVKYNMEVKSYKELNDRANQIARSLILSGIKSNEYVGLYLDRDINFIEAMLAVLKVGGIYVPIDKTYPLERKNYIISNSNLKYIISDIDELNDCKFEGEVININDTVNILNKSNINCAVDEDSSAYVIYTSGSTGNPKGVEVTHKNVSSLLFPDENNFTFSKEDCWTAFHSFCFDFSVWEIYGALLYGGKLVIVPNDIAKDSVKFNQLIINEKVTILNQTPTAFYAYIDSMKNSREHSHRLRYVIFGGEALNPKKLKQWAEKNRGTSLVNMYGITETTVHVTYKLLTKKDFESAKSNIGKPINTLKHYIFDEDMKLLPKNMVGELYIAGHGVSKGYLNQLKLTEERFIQNPYNNKEKLYKTGDLVLESFNGDLEYIGRKDSQVKIRGYRIEIGEVENKINNLSGVDNCKVLLADNEALGKHLICYIDSEIEESNIRHQCNAVLPPYMIPAEFIKVKHWPLTLNGKVDLNELEKYKNQLEGSSDEKQYLNYNQKKISEIWSSILGKKINDIYKSFFELGGHSLLVAKVIMSINENLNTNLSFIDFYKNPTIYQLDNLISDSDIKKESEYCQLINILEEQNENNIFFIHGGNARVDTYSEFTKKGLNNFNIYGIELYKNHKLELENITCEELASQYIELIHQKQLRGPFYIFGTCIGGTIAYEIASQLESKFNEKVYLFLASVDAPTSFENTMHDSKNVYIKKLIDKTKYESSGIENEINWAKFVENLENSNLSLEDLSEILDHSMHNLSQRTYKEMIYRKNLTQDLVAMRENYYPYNKLKAKVYYFGASEQPLLSANDWEKFCEDIEYIIVKGNHDSIFQNPNVTEFVETFKVILDKIDVEEL